MKKTAASKPRAAKAKAAGKTPGTAPRAGVPSQVPPAFAPVVARLDERIGEFERQFEVAKKEFAKAIKTRAAGGRAQGQKSLAEQNTEMRVLTAHWTELLWVRRLLQEQSS